MNKNREKIRRGAGRVLFTLIVAGWMGNSAMAAVVLVLSSAISSEIDVNKLRIDSGSLRVAGGGEIIKETELAEPYHTLKINWGIQWPLDGLEFLDNVVYDVFMEFYMPAAYKNENPAILVKLYSFSDKKSEPLGFDAIKSADYAADQWHTAKIANRTLAGFNGYFYLTSSPIPDAPTMEQLRIRKFWAVPAAENDKALIEVAYNAKVEAGKIEDDYKNAYSVKKYPQIEKKYLFGFFGNRVPALLYNKWYGLTSEEQLKIENQAARAFGFNAASYEMIQDPEFLKTLDTVLGKYGMHLLAGSAGAPLDNRYASPAVYKTWTIEKQREYIKKMTDAGKQCSSLIAYMLSDEPKKIQTVPLMKAVKLFEEYDPTRPAIVSSGFDYNSIPMSTLFYPFRQEAQVMGVPEMAAGFDVMRTNKEGNRCDAPIWGMLQAYETNGGWLSPEEMEGQIFAGLACRLTGQFFHIYYTGPSWSSGSHSLVDEFMLPKREATAVYDRMSAIAQKLQGIGELLTEGDYIEDKSPHLKADIKKFETSYAARQAKELHDNVRIGLYRVSGGRGYIAILVNQNVYDKTSQVIKYTPESSVKNPVCIDLFSFKDLKSTSPTLVFNKGEGKVVWMGDAAVFPDVKDEILFTRALWQSRILRDKFAVVKNYMPAEVPDMSWVDSAKAQGRKGVSGAELNKKYEAALAKYTLLRNGNNLYSRIENALQAKQQELSAKSQSLPKGKESWQTTFPQLSPGKQKFCEASGLYFKALLKHWDTGLGADEMENIAQRVNTPLVTVGEN
jgi:hypothetical protein